ncbi:RHS repeat protein [Streptomyces sp. RPA4-5]|uniref:RHS repeat-associated core domain-containing protein n=1 Tax=Streptomyces sp. RPA4-5 TaxID=2721245 RepID=UPI00143E4B6E|nr:RHS repeat-associated core domain-containing protein [Streptomyces sp. RPA4-5]QIY53496.1 RHS repeat protein [Streptomyces sp. RPA4-5]
MGVVLPGWADEVLDIIGVSWPNVDEDDYREMADAMREFADDIDDGANEAHTAIQGLVSSAGGSIAVEALNAHWSKINGTHLKNLGECGRMAATALDGVAILIEGAKLGAIVQLGILAAEVIAAQAAAPFTLGLSEVGALAATQATRVIVKRLFKEVCQQVAEQVVSMALTPVEEALGAMVGDLVVQLGANALGVQDGVDLGQTAKAGKEGFNQGVQGAKKSAKSAADNPMELLSAGGRGGGRGGSGGSGGSGFSHDPEEHDRVVTGLQSASGTFRNKAGGKIGRAKSHHGRTRGKDAIADAANAMLDKVIDGIEKGLKKAAKHLDDSMTRGIKQMAKNHHDNDKALADHFKGIGKNDKKDPKAPNANGSKSPRKSNDRGADGKARQQLDKEHPNNNSRVDLAKKGCGDPVDVATGRVYLTETDIVLPGVTMPLVFRRKFESSCRVGRHIGPSWTSTIDQRLEIDEQGIVFVTEDGMLLSYPIPELGQSALPDRGPRWPLTSAEHGDWAVHNPDSGLTRYFTEAQHSPGLALLDEITDRNGNHITFDYEDQTGVPLAMRHSGGYHLKFTSDERSRVTALHLAGGAQDGSDVLVMTYGHDDAGNLTEVTNSTGIPNRFEYDHEHRMTAWVDTNGSRYEYIYDQQSRCISQGGSDGHLRYTYVYGSLDPQTGHRVTAATNSLGHTTSYRINEHLQMVAETDPLGNTTHTTYDDADRPLSVTDPLGHTTRYIRDEHGRVTTVHLPDGSQTHASYNELNLPTEVIELGGLTWRYVYDERGNRLTQTDPVGATTRYSYSQAGHLTSVTDPFGATTVMTTNAAGLSLSVTDPQGATASCTRDEFGRVTYTTDPAGNTMHMRWSVEGQRTWRQLADGSQEKWDWDGEGNLTSYTDCNGRTTTHSVTRFDQPAAATNGDGSHFSFTHDTELRLTAVTGTHGRSWTYTYDPAGRLAAETDFDGRTLTYQHDAAGRLIARTNGAGQTLRFEHDSLGQVVRLLDDDGPVATYGYATTGAMTKAVNASARITITRDRQAGFTDESVNGRVLRRSHDLMGRLTSRRTPIGAASSWTFDETDDVTTYVTADHTLRLSHDALGRETSRTLDDTLCLTHAWDFAGHITHQTVNSSLGTTVERFFGYRQDGRLESVNDQLTGRRSYTRDRTGRVTGVEAEGWSERYGYTAAGDQKAASWSSGLPGKGAMGERIYLGSRVSRAGRTHYQYDAQGRVIMRQRARLSRKPDTWRYTWNAEDRLTTATTPEGHTWHYQYDALGRRIGKQHHDAQGQLLEETVFTWDGHLLLEESTQQAGAPFRIVLTWDYLGERPISQTERKIDISSGKESDRRFFLIVTSPVGTPTELVDENGAVAWRARSTLWGVTAWSRDSTAYTPLRAAGQYHDRETGLHYNFNRYYDPEIGRYLSPDPLGLGPAPNHYTYVDDPLAYTDPLGLAKKCRDDITWGGRVTWQRDHRGRQYEMRAVVTRDMLDEGTEVKDSLRTGGYLGKRYGHARGHMLARRLGGTGDDLDNLFTISQNPTNTPEMTHYENLVYHAAKKGPVQYNVYLEYADDNAKIPKYIQMEAFNHRGELLFDAPLDNPAHLDE